MNVDQILHVMEDEKVDFILIGGMNFLLRHLPELTFDVDIWVRDDAENLAALNRALGRLGAEWGLDEAAWKRVPMDWAWLCAQGVFCLTTNYGALDVFRDVRGLENQYAACKVRAIPSTTAGGVPFHALSDEDMLACQEALPEKDRKERRIRTLREAIARKGL